MKYEELQKINDNNDKEIKIFKKKKMKKKKKKVLRIRFYFFIPFILLLFIAFEIYKKMISNKTYINATNESKTYATNTTNESKTYATKEGEFNDEINQNYLNEQKNFCLNQDKLNKSLIDNQIQIVKAHLNDIYFEMFVYKNKDIVSNEIRGRGSWEAKDTNIILSILEYYSKKRNVDKKDIYIIDIGANIGWYSFLLGKKGYNILSFEPSKTNYYILRKTYCLNNNMNITFINKGLDKVENITFLYHPIDNIGNAMLASNFLKDFIKEEIILTKLNNYLNFFKNKNLALIKIDIEGSEGKAVEGGIDFISKYHVPFIIMEFNPISFRKKGVDPKAVLEIFYNNGYKISIKDFLNKEYMSIDDLLKVGLVNLYIVYPKFFE